MLDRRREGALHLRAQRRHGPEARPAVGDELHECQPLPGSEFRGHREAGIVGMRFGPRFCAARSAHDVIHRRRDAQPAVRGAVDEHRSAFAGRRGLPLEAESATTSERGAVLIHSTTHSRLRIAAAMDHIVRGPRGTETRTEAHPDDARFTVTSKLGPGQRLTLVKFVAYGWSSLRTVPALRSQVEGALATAVEHGWNGLARAQRTYLSDFWSRADVELEGDDEVQQGIRFAMFHVLQAAARAEQRAIPAKGLTGPGYDGHSFWDTETFVLPLLTYSVPEAAADILRWRFQILDQARRRARDLGLEGAAFPWRTIHGEECSGYWPASTAAFHVTADIADGVRRYVSATDDRKFEADHGAE